MDMFIGENIRRLRREKGITQEVLAERLHVSAAAVSKWERGDSIPDIGMLLPLASYFNVSTDELLGVDSAKTTESLVHSRQGARGVRSDCKRSQGISERLAAYGGLYVEARL